jgi:hypothetical protein
MDQFVVMVLLFIKQKSACANDRRNNAHYCHVTLLTRRPSQSRQNYIVLRNRRGRALLVDGSSGEWRVFALRLYSFFFILFFFFC